MTHKERILKVGKTYWGTYAGVLRSCVVLEIPPTGRVVVRTRVAPFSCTLDNRSISLINKWFPYNAKTGALRALLNQAERECRGYAKCLKTAERERDKARARLVAWVEGK